MRSLKLLIVEFSVAEGESGTVSWVSSYYEITGLSDICALKQITFY